MILPTSGFCGSKNFDQICSKKVFNPLFVVLAKTVVAAAASFRVETKEDCEFPTPTENMDLFYFYSIIVLGPFTVLILIDLCYLRSKMNNLMAGQAPPGWGQQQK